MEIRRLAPDEGTRLRDIRLRALRDAPDAFASTYEETAAREAASWRRQLLELATWVAVVGGEDVGVVRAGPHEGRAGPHESRAGDAILLSMWVAPAHRGRGVGEALIATAVEWARAEGFDRLVLEVVDSNAPALALYERLGFAPTGRTSAFPPPRAHVREHERALPLRGISS